MSAGKSNQQHFVATDRGEWWLADTGLAPTRVTQAQLDAINELDHVESMGSSDVRFGDVTGELCVFHTDHRVTLVAEDGTTEDAEF